MWSHREGLTPGWWISQKPISSSAWLSWLWCWLQNFILFLSLNRSSIKVEFSIIYYLLRLKHLRFFLVNVKEALSKATLEMSLVTKYLDRADLVSRLANAAASFVGLMPFVSEWTAFPESNGKSPPEMTCGGFFSLVCLGSWEDHTHI